MNQQASTELPTRKSRFFSFVSNCYNSVKETIKSCHTYASKYDAYQTQELATKSGYDPLLVEDVTPEMIYMLCEPATEKPVEASFSKNLIGTITSTLIYATFMFVNCMHYEAKSVQNLFAEKKPEPKEMRGAGVDFVPFMGKSPEMKFKIHSARIQVRDSFLLNDKSMDREWGFIKDDLTVNFQSTLAPLKPPRGLFRKTKK
ncbi:hypothetical protein BD770DRAFT_475965 [Pilaira anomala]|nr:hypothetical protein BD770DRAFT_475965 [Pilaira anomala]